MYQVAYYNFFFLHNWPINENNTWCNTRVIVRFYTRVCPRTNVNTVIYDFIFYSVIIISDYRLKTLGTRKVARVRFWKKIEFFFFVIRLSFDAIAGGMIVRYIFDTYGDRTFVRSPRKSLPRPCHDENDRFDTRDSC